MSHLKSKSSRAFSLVEIVVVAGILVLLAALLIPSIKSMRGKASQVKCAGNLRSIAFGFNAYLADNSHTYPGNGTASSAQSGAKYFRWMYRVGPYMDFASGVTMRSSMGGPAVPTLDTGFTEPVFHCPATPPKLYSGPNPPLESVGVYGYNETIGDNNVDPTKTTGVRASLIQNPARTVLLADRFIGGGSRPQDTMAMGANLFLAAPYPVNRNGASANHRADRNPAANPLGAGPCNFLFADGHVETLELSKLRPWIDSPGNRTGITFKLD